MLFKKNIKISGSVKALVICFFLKKSNFKYFYGNSHENDDNITAKTGGGHEMSVILCNENFKNNTNETEMLKPSNDKFNCSEINMYAALPVKYM